MVFSSNPRTYAHKFLPELLKSSHNVVNLSGFLDTEIYQTKKKQLLDTYEVLLKQKKVQWFWFSYTYSYIVVQEKEGEDGPLA